jgi:hypothetical protein
LQARASRPSGRAWVTHRRLAVRATVVLEAAPHPEQVVAIDDGAVDDLEPRRAIGTPRPDAVPDADVGSEGASELGIVHRCT